MVGHLNEELNHLRSLLQEQVTLTRQALNHGRSVRIDTGPLWEKQNQAWAKELVRLIRKYFNEDDIQELLFNFNLTYGDFRNGGRHGAIRRIVLYFYNRGTLSELALYCQLVRPKVPWPLTAVEVSINEQPKGELPKDYEA
jgi:hypothetical protein